MIPTIGRIVHYTLSKYDADAINVRTPNQRGNMASEGDVYPALIVRNWTAYGVAPAETQAVQLQVFIDGDYTYWATSRCQGTGPGTWCEPPRL